VGSGFSPTRNRLKPVPTFSPTANVGPALQPAAVNHDAAGELAEKGYAVEIVHRDAKR